MAGIGGTTGIFRGPFGSTYVEAGRANDVFRLSYFSPRFSGFQFGASYSPAAQEDAGGSYDRDAVLHDGIAVGANFVESFNGFDVAVAGGYSQWEAGTGASDPSSWSVGVNLGFSGFTVGGSYAHAESDPAVGDMDGWDVGVGYSTGPWGVSLIYYHGERDGSAVGTCTPCKAEMDTVHGSVAYSMGPGIKFVGTIGYTSLDDKSGGAGADNDSTYFVVGPKLSF
jgi:predicted porin